MPQSTAFRRSNSRIRSTGLVLLAIALIATAITAVSVAQNGGSKRVAKEAQNPTLGKTVLTSTTGRTLYSLSVEKNGKFICTHSCLSAWHPLTVPAGVKPTGPVKLGTIARPEGGIQVTYKGRPLYRFSGDTKAGEANGEGIKDVGTWHAATPPQPKAEPAPQPSPENPYDY
jgi:predicted lipoprotein with Yx(FWY)xxD motif